jgi:hypothetical protein
MLDCVGTLIGLSANPIPCFGSAPDGYEVSDLGYHVADQTHGVPVDSTEQQEKGWEILAAAKSGAERELRSDLHMSLGEHYRNTGAQTGGWIGERTYGGVEAVTGTYGWRIKPASSKQRDKSLIIEVIALSLSSAATATVKVFDRTGTELYTEQVNAGGKSFLEKRLATPWKLPLFDTDTPDVYYTFVVTANSPCTTKLECCGGSYKLSSSVEITAGKCDADGSNFEQQDGAMGISISARIECDNLEWVCTAIKAGDYSVRNVIGRTLQARAAALAIQMFLTQNQIGFTTLYNAEALSQRAAMYNTNYRGWLQWLVENLPQDFSRCWSCHEARTATKIEILV